MDDIVKQAMLKWPNVPAVYGWLALDRRGNWLIQGERIPNPAIVDFINRNYARDQHGRWYFQNGPQRVFVALAYTPLVYRVGANTQYGARLHLDTHTGNIVDRVEGAWIDESGIVLLATEHGVGMVQDRDLDCLLPCFTDEHGGSLTEDDLGTRIERIQTGAAAALRFSYRDTSVSVSPIKARRVALQFGFVPLPTQSPGQEECI